MRENQRRLRVSPSLVISILALVIATSTGAYAATIAAKNSVVSKSIKNGEVKTKDLANNAVNAKKIKDGQVGSAEIADGSVTSTDIADGSVTSADIGDGQIGVGDLSAAAQSDLNDAATLGGLTVAQIVAASGGEYIEANQAGGNIDVEVLPANEKTVATLELPHAGKWLISTRVPVTCVWDNTPAGGDPDPATANAVDNPYFYAQSRLKIGTTVLQSETETCAVEAGQAIVLGVAWVGTATISMNRLVTVAGPTTLTLTGSSAPSNVLGVDVVASAHVTANASGSKLSAITVQP